MNKHTLGRLTGALLTVVAAAGLAACTSTVSRGVNDQGQADEIIFPDIDKTSGIHEGIFPNVENLRKISTGVTKDDLYYLIGRPHFRETLGAREWDYVMKFREVPHGPVTICQYKVIFDKDMKGQSFYWAPEDCARFVNGQPLAAPAKSHVISLKGDTLFRFDGSALADMLPGGRSELDRLAGELRQLDSNSHMRVVGHTDRLGSDAYNLALSQRRAETVRRYLVDQGVPAANISAAGMGESQPVVQCTDTARAALVACLQSNRRVDVEISGAR